MVHAVAAVSCDVPKFYNNLHGSQLSSSLQKEIDHVNTLLILCIIQVEVCTIVLGAAEIFGPMSGGGGINFCHMS